MINTGRYHTCSATIVVLCLLTAASAASAGEVAPLLTSGEYVALQLRETLYLLDRSGPSWLVFRMPEPVKSFVFHRRLAPSGDADFSIDGKAVRYVRFKGVLVFPDGAAVLSRRPPFSLRAVHTRVDRERWSISKSENDIHISHRSAEQTQYDYARRAQALAAAAVRS